MILRVSTDKGREVVEDVPMQTNEAYCTVTTGVVMKRNEAYQTVLSHCSHDEHSNTTSL